LYIHIYIYVYNKDIEDGIEGDNKKGDSKKGDSVLTSHDNDEFQEIDKIIAENAIIFIYVYIYIYMCI
jgi:hypothetical protein